MTTKHIAITFGIVCLLLSIGLHYCIPKPKHKVSKYDSLIWANKILSKQYGMMSAEAQAQGLRAAKAEAMARERDTVYLTRTKVIYKQAPDTCQPYLNAMAAECDTLVLTHVQSGLVKDTLIEMQTAIIANRNEVIANDSTHIAAMNSHIATLDSKIEQQQRKTKVAKFFNKVLIGAAVLFTAVVGVMTVAK